MLDAKISDVLTTYSSSGTPHNGGQFFKMGVKRWCVNHPLLPLFLSLRKTALKDSTSKKHFSKMTMPNKEIFLSESWFLQYFTL